MSKSVLGFVAAVLISHSAFALEGFYPAHQLPQQYLSQLSLDEKVIQNALYTAGAIGSWYIDEIKSDNDLIQRKKQVQSAHPTSLRWNHEFYHDLNALTHCSDTQPCRIKRLYDACSGGFITDGRGYYFATAKHCLEYLWGFDDRFEEKARTVRFEDRASGGISHLEVEAIPSSLHGLPFEAIIFAVKPTDVSRVQFTQIAKQPAQVGDSVFGIAIQSLKDRTQIGAGVPAYDFNAVGLRVTLGKVIEPNLERKSYCALSNDIDVANPKSWKLQSSCADFDYSALTYVGHEDRNPMLTDTDMIYGVSGSLLYNAQGEALAIGNTVLASTVGNYVADSYGVYNKAENLLPLLKIESRNRDPKRP